MSRLRCRRASWVLNGGWLAQPLQGEAVGEGGKADGAAVEVVGVELAVGDASFGQFADLQVPGLVAFGLAAREGLVRALLARVPVVEPHPPGPVGVLGEQRVDEQPKRLGPRGRLLGGLAELGVVPLDAQHHGLGEDLLHAAEVVGDGAHGHPGGRAQPLTSRAHGSSRSSSTTR
ncbi:hypothetical protein GCM10022403_002150 [Streptomyces coacervatus]|uniref:Uncharacterized protein n=1 Tax=Streptomyces coacervatus TaxID=647381 RepID=A0ABP7GPR2_9ACTN